MESFHEKTNNVVIKLLDLSLFETVIIFGVSVTVVFRELNVSFGKFSNKNIF